MGCMPLCSNASNNNIVNKCCMEINPKNNNDNNTGNIENQNSKNSQTSYLVGNNNMKIIKVANRLNYDFTPTSYPLMDLVHLKFK